MARVKLDRKGGFKKGHRLSVGNKGPQAKLHKRYLTAALNDELSRLDRTKKYTNTRKVIQRMVQLAKAGDFQFVKEIFDRVEGKPVQAIEMSGKGGSAIKTITGQMTIEEAARAYAETIEADGEE